MLSKVESKKMGKSNLGWLNSTFHFSFADYYNPQNIQFGALRVLNDDLVQPNMGFDMHPHKNMEIISYVVSGTLTHQDSMGNKNTISRGHVQYMSAGTGVFHSEHNLGKEILRFLQIWILPDKKDYTPAYGDYLFHWEERNNKWLHLVSSKTGQAPITINQDVNIYAVALEANHSISFTVEKNRQAYLVIIEGQVVVNNIELDTKDALEITEESITITVNQQAHLLLLEMKAS